LLGASVVERGPERRDVLGGREDMVMERQWGFGEEAQQRLGFIRQRPVKTAPTEADLKFSRRFGAAKTVPKHSGTMGLEVVTQSLAI
jgi:hypothetical protein